MAKKPKQSTSELVAAIKFCSVASRDIGQPYQSHFMFGKGWLCAFDGVIAAAFPVKSGDVVCCPNADMFRTAIGKAKADLAMTISPDGDKISIVTGKLRANVPCIYSSEYPFYPPDNSVGTIDNRLRAAIMTCGTLISESASRLVDAAMLMRTNSCVSTDGKSLFESWHGLPVPTLILPKALAVALEKLQDYNLASFGFSDKSLTLYFDNGAWIKTQLYDGAVKDYPDVDKLTARLFPATLIDVPSDLFEGIEIITKFADDGLIEFDHDKMETSTGNASYTIDLAPLKAVGSVAGTLKSLFNVKWATQWNISSDAAGSTYFFTGKVYGEPCRAIVMGIPHKHLKEHKIKSTPETYQSDADSEVPY